MTNIETTNQRLTDDRAHSLLEQIRSIKVADEPSYLLMVGLLQRAKSLINTLEAKFQPAIAAAHKSHKENIQIRDESVASFEEAEKLAKDKLALYYQTAANVPDVEGLSFSDCWKIDITDETLVPREYLTPDLAKIKGVAKALGLQCAIPGVKVVKATTITVKGA